MSDIKYMHVPFSGNKSNNQEGWMTIASSKGYGDILTFSVSFCSPKDKFVKKMGVEICNKRMKTCLSGYASFVEIGDTFEDNYIKILCKIVAMGLSPHWAKKKVIKTLYYALASSSDDMLSLFNSY